MSEHNHMTNGNIVQGASGTAVTLVSVLVSILPQIEIGLRIASLLVGLAVGILTLVSLWRKVRNQRQSDD